MSVDLDRLRLSLEAMIGRMEPGARLRLARQMGRAVKTANAARIRANLTPEGAAMVPRKRRVTPPNPLGRPEPIARAKTGRMFRKAASPRYLRVNASADGVDIGFRALGARILRIHQDGGREQVSARPDAPFADYPARPLLGLSAEDRERLLAMAAATLDD